MRERSSRCLWVWVVLLGVAFSYGASAATVSDAPGSPFGGGVWVWELPLTATEVGNLTDGDEVIIKNVGDKNWSYNGWTTSQTPGFKFHADQTTQQALGATVLKWIVDDRTKVIVGTQSFVATPVGASDVTGTWEIDATHATIDSGGPAALNHVPQIPEAGTLALLGMGLFAGALVKWRRKSGSD